MAEIHIERKERSTWPWVLLGLLILALLAWWLMSRGDGNDFATQDTTVPYVDTTNTPVTGAVAGGAVSEFVQWTNQNQAQQASDTTHEYTATGIRHLAAAIESMWQQGDTAANGAAVRAQIDSMRTNAEALQQRWSASDHANHARQAFMQASTALETVRQQRFPNQASTVQQVREAATNVQGNQPLLQQQTQVQQFFQRAAQTLQSMSGAAS